MMETMTTRFKLCCGIALLMCANAQAADWTDGFNGSVGNWSTRSGTAMTYSTAYTHATYTGAGCMSHPAASSEMYRSTGTRPYHAGKASAWFYDTARWREGFCGNKYRQFLGFAASTYTSYQLAVGHNSAVGPGNFYKRDSGNNYTSIGAKGTRTACDAGWVYFEIEFQADGDCYRRADDGVVNRTDTAARSSGIINAGIGMVTVGLGASSTDVGYWDDISWDGYDPGTPTGIAATANSTSEITWTASAASDGNQFGFALMDGTTEKVVSPTSARQTSASLTETGLSANTSYTRAIRAWNGDNNSTSSTTATKYTLQETPTAPSFSNVTETSFQVSTTGPVKLTDGSSGVIFHDGSADRTKVTVLYEDLTGLTANTQYTYKAKGVNGDGVATAYSGTTSVYTLATVPTLNTNVATTADNSTWYNAASWPGLTNPQGFGTGGKVSKFKYKWSTNASDTIVEDEGTDWASDTMSTKPASDGAEWYLYLRSYNGDNKGNGSVKLGPFKYDGTAPNAAPAYSTGASTSGIIVNFGASSGDSLSGLATAAYKVTRGSYDSGWVTSGPVNDPAADIADGGSATYTVTTIDNAGNQATDTVTGRKPLAATNNWVFTTKAVSLALPGLYPQQLAANTKVFASSDGQVYGFGGAAASALWVPVATGGAVQGRVIPATLAGELTALAGSQDGKVYARKVSDGTARWTHDFGGSPVFKVTAKPAGVIGVTVNGSYTGDVVFAATDADSDQNMLRAFQAGDGTVLWTYSATLGPILGSPLVLPSKGLVVFATMPGGSDTGRVVAVNIADGSLEWQNTAVGDVRSAVSPDGAEATVFAVNQSGQLYALDSSNGTAKSGFPVSVGATGIYGAPMWHGNGPRLYVSSLGDTFYALNPANGGTATGWSSSVSVTGPSNPVVFNQRVYVGSADGNLYEYNINTGAQTGYRAIGSTVGDPVVDAWLSRIYVGAGDGRIYSFSLPF